jgi:hypothetical protein
MAYTRVNWKARKGTNLNKFTKSAETPTSVILTNAPDAVTDSGTPFSVENMNIMDEGIANLDTAVTNLGIQTGELDTALEDLGTDVGGLSGNLADLQEEVDNMAGDLGRGFKAGAFYEQLPDSDTPAEAGLPGAWEVWSGRAVMYGLSQAAPPSFDDYYSKAGTTIAAGSVPVVCYHQAGTGWRLYRFIAQTAAYTVPDELDPVKWEYLQPGVINERRKCGNALADSDYAIGAQIPTGAYQGMYVTEVLALGGGFGGYEGGNRPTFISGGRQEGRIVDITGYIHGREIDNNADLGAFYSSDISSNSKMALASGSGYAHFFAASRVVKTGPDVAGANWSKRLWRRVL